MCIRDREVDARGEELDGILVTHDHIDHIKGVGIVSRKYKIPIYANSSTWKAMAGSIGEVHPDHIRYFESDRPFEIKDLRIEPFRTSHDAVDPVGFSKMCIRDRDYRIRHSHGIEYHFKADDLNYMDDLAETTQKVIGEVDGNFKRGESKPFKMVIYPNDMELNTGIKAPSREKTLGAYYGGNIFLLSPTELSGTETPIENVILHEYTHLLVEELTRGRHPVWLTEGIALLQEYLITGYQWGRTGRRLPYSLDDLEAHFYRLDTHHAYHSSFYLSLIHI